MKAQSTYSAVLKGIAFSVILIGLAALNFNASAQTILSENFDGFTQGGTSCGSACTLSNGWTNETGDDIDWCPDAGGTTSSSTGPTVDHTTGGSSGKYLYTESSGCYSKTANATTPTLSFVGYTAPVLKFWYHMYGSTMGTLNVDISTNGGTSYTNLWTKTGNQQFTQTDPWFEANIDLTAYANMSNIVIRFQGITGTSFYSDMAFDDVEIFNLVANDAGVISLPFIPFCAGLTSVSAEIKNFGAATLTSATINWSVNGVAQSPYSWTGSLATNATTTATLGNYSFSSGVSYDFAAWTSSPNASTDGDHTNDSTVMSGLMSALSGTYTIGTSGNYSDFSSAVAALSAYGVCGPVTFNVASGTYTEQLTINAIIGASAVNTITFQSATGNNTDVIIQNTASSTSDNWTVKLDGASYVTFKNMTVKALNSSYACVFELANAANYNTIDGNIIESAGTSSYNRGIYAYTGKNEYNTYSNNTISGGYYGMYIYGNSSTDLAKGNVVDGNDISSFYYYAVFSYYQDSIKITNNYIHDGTSYSYHRGIYCYYNYNGFEIANNNIVLNSATSYSYGIYLGYCNRNTYATGNEAIGMVYNNMVSITTGSSTNYGIYTGYSEKVNYYFNSVAISAGSTSSRAFYKTNSTSYNVYTENIVNNIFACSNGGYAYYINGSIAAGFVGTSDYNDYYTTGSNLAYWSTTTCTDLTALQTANSQDANSQSTDPSFTSASDLHTMNVSLDGQATPVTGITTDIDGDARDVSTPDIGADEFVLMLNDAGVVSMDAPVTACPNVTENVTVTFNNYGVAVLNNVVVNWAVNGVVQTPVSYTTSIPVGGNAQVSLGSFTFQAGITYNFDFWTTLPNGVADQQTSNDSLAVAGFQTSMTGSYTIGGATPDFNTFTDAVNALNANGVCGPVTINVTAGTYTESVSLGAIAGASATNTITFIGNMSDSTAVSLTGTSSPTIDLNASENVTFKYMNINAPSSGRAVQLQGGASHNVFSNNHFVGYSTTSSSYLYAIIYNYSGSIEDSNTISNNYFTQGSYAAYWYGSGTTSLESGTVIHGNVVDNTYYYGFYVYYQDAPVITNNIIIGSQTYGLYCRYMDNNFLISGNQIFNTGSYNIYMYYCDGTSSNPGEVSNNFLGGASTYSWYNFYPKYHNIYYNNINQSGSSYGLYLYNNSSTYGGHNILNNNFYTTGGYAAYVNNGSYLNSADYNNFYSTASSFVYWGSSQSDLAALQTSYPSQNQNSLSVDPGYYTSTDLHVTNASLDGAGTPIAGVTTDIDGDARNATTPDIGADEFMTFPFDIGAQALVSPVSGFCYGSSETVIVQIRNYGTAQANFVTDPITLNVSVTGPNATTFTPVTINSGTLDKDSTMDVTISTNYDMSAPGTYSFNAYTSSISDLNAMNDAMNQVDINYVLISTMPYQEGFEADFGGWVNETGDDEDWTRISGGTGSFGTGPNSAHEGAYYIYTETSGNYNNEFWLTSPCMNVSALSSAKLAFHYHMVGATMGDLYVQQMISGSWDTIYTLFGQQQLNQSDPWLQAIVDLNPAAEKIRFAYYSGTSYTGDCALDNIIINEPPVVDLGTDVAVCDGVSTLFDAGAGAGYTYDWTTLNNTTTFATTQTISVDTSGTFVVVVTDSLGFSSSDTVVHNVNPLPSGIISGTTTICDYDSALISFTFTGTPPFNFDVLAGTSTTTYTSNALTYDMWVAPSATTQYRLTSVTDANTCNISGNLGIVVVTVNTAPAVSVGADAAVCSGNSIGLYAQASGGDGSYTYNWAPGATLNGTTIPNPLATPITTTTYNVTVTDGNTCIATDDIMITVNELPTADAGADVYVCNGSSVQLGASASNGQSPYTYSWTPTTDLDNAAIANPNASPTSATTYTVQVTDANGCVDDDDMLVNVLTVDAGADVAICTGNSTTLTATVTGGTGSESYLWDNGATLSNNTIANPVANPTATTTYTVTVSDGGITCTDQVVVTVNALPVISFSGLNADYCVDAAAATLAGTPNGGTFTGAGITGNQFDPAVAGVGTWSVTYTYTDGNGCTNSDIQSVVVNDLPLVNFTGLSAGYCLDAGAASLTGIPAGGAFSGNGITGSTFTPSVAAVGTHAITYSYTDANGCTNTRIKNVEVYALPTANAGSDFFVCAGAPANLNVTPGGGLSPYTYNWSPADSLNNPTAKSPIAQNTISETYYVTVTDANGCVATDDVYVSVVLIPVADAGSDVAICPGGTTQLYATGGTNYVWTPTSGLSNPNVSDPFASPAVTTVYTVNVSSTCGSAQDQVVVTVYPQVSVNAGVDQTICEGSSANLNAIASGQAPYTYAWSPATGLSATNVSNPVASPTTVTTYTVTVTDANGCTGTDDITINVNPVPAVTATASTEYMCPGGSSDLLATSPTATLYIWSPSTYLNYNTIQNPSATGIMATTTYTVTASDANGCASTDAVTVNVIDVDAGADQEICLGGSTQLNATSNYNATAWNWSPAAGLSATNIANPVAGPTVNTTYYVTITDASGVTCSDSVMVTVNPLPTVTVADVGTCTSGSAQLNAVAGAGTTPYSYMWNTLVGLSDSTIADPFASPTATTVYTVTVTDSKGCIATDDATVTVHGVAGVDAGSDMWVSEGAPTPLSATPTAGTAPYTFAWSPAADLNDSTLQNPTATPFDTTVYTVLLTDANGCTATDDVTIYTLVQATADAGPDQTLCFGDTAQLQAIGGNTYVWSPPTGLSNPFISNPKANPTTTTIYFVTVTSTWGQAVDWVTITVRDSLWVNTTSDVICAGDTTNLTATGGGGAGPYTYEWSPATEISDANSATPDVWPATTTTYTVTVTDANGCTAKNSSVVTVNQLANISFAPTNDICSGSSVQILTQVIGTPPYTYNWIGGNPGDILPTNAKNPIASPAVTTTFTLTVNDGNGCVATADKDIIVNPLPSVSFSGLMSEYCVDNAVDTLVGSPAGGVYTGAGMNGDVFDPAVAGVGTYAITYTYTDGNGCVDDEVQNVTVHALPTVSFSGLAADYCIDVDADTLIGSPAGGTFTGTGISGDVFDPAVAGAGTYDITYTYTDVNGCVNSDIQQVVVNDLPVVSFSGLDTAYCVDDAFAQLTGSPLGGTFSGNGVNVVNGRFFPNIAGVGTHDITYTYTDANGCVNSDIQTVVVNDLPVVSYSNLDLEYCVDGTPDTIVGSPVGGTFTGPGFTGDVFDPAVAGVGTWSMTYTYTDGNGCTNDTVGSVTVHALPTVVFNALGDVCGDAPTFPLSGGLPPDGFLGGLGVYSGAGVDTNYFDAATAGVGTHILTYTFTDANGCLSSDTSAIVVNPIPSINAMTNDSVICDGDNANLVALPSGGTPPYTYIWDNPTTLTNPSAQNPIASPLGTTLYHVTITDVNGCTAEDSVEVFISLPVADAGTDFAICDNDSAQLIVTPSNGIAPYTYIWSPAGSLNDAFIQNPIATPSVLTTYNVTITDNIGCLGYDDVTVSINGLPTVTATSNSPVCENDTLILNSTSQGGNTGLVTCNTNCNFVTPCPIIIGSNANDYIQEVVLDGNTNTSAAGATSVEDFTSSVLATLYQDSTYNISIVQRHTVATPPNTPADEYINVFIDWNRDGNLNNDGGPVYSGTNNHFNFFAFNGTITVPSSALLGETVMRIINTEGTNAGGGCGNLSALNGEIEDYVVNIVGFASNPITNWDWTGPNSFTATVANTGIGNVSLAADGDYVITVTDDNGCMASDTVPVIINALPLVNFTGLNDEYCDDASAVTLTSNQTGGLFTGPGITDLGNGTATFAPAIAGAGVYTITFGYVDGNGCFNDTVASVTVNAIPVVTMSPLADVCVDAAAFALTGGAPAGGTYSGTGVDTLGSFDPSVAGAGTHTITYYYADPVTGCDDVATTIINVNALPVVSFTTLPDICASAAPYQVSPPPIHVSPFGPGGVYTGTGLTTLGNTVTFDPAVAGAGTHILTYTYTDGNGCVSSDTTSVNVLSAPVADAGVDTTICDGFSINLNASASGGSGNYTYSWTPTAPIYGSTNIVNPVVNPSVTTDFVFTVTDGSSCVGTDTVRVFVGSNPNVILVPSVAVCLGDSVLLDVFVPSGSIAPYTYNWAPANTLTDPTSDSTYAFPTVLTNYVVTVTGSDGCFTTEDVDVEVYPVPSVTTTDAYICNGTSAQLVATPSGGTPGYSFSWSPTTGLSNPNNIAPIADPLSTTTYVVTVTDVNGCIGTDESVVTVLEVQASTNDSIICVGDSALLTATGIGGDGLYTYNWAPSAGLSSVISQTPMASPAATTTYYVTITDGYGISCVDSVTVDVFGVDLGADVVACYNDSVQLFTAVAGGSGPAFYTYAWSPATGLSSASIRNPWANPSVETTYTVTVTDQVTGFSCTDDVVVGRNTEITVDVGQDIVVCEGTQINLLATVSGGDAPYTYNWVGTPPTPPPPAQTIISPTNVANPVGTPNGQGIHNFAVIVADANGCSVTDDKNVTALTIAVANAGSDDTICYGGSVQLNATGGSSYTWAPASSLDAANIYNPIASPTATTNYTVTVTSSCGVAFDIVKVVVNPIPVTYNVTGGGAYCSGGLGVVVGLDGSETGAEYELYLDGASTGLNVNGTGSAITFGNQIDAGTYTVVATYTATGCENNMTGSVDVIVHPLPSATVSGTTTICNGGNAQITVDLTGAAPWEIVFFDGSTPTTVSNIASTPYITTVTPTATTTYSVVSVTDANTCLASGSGSATVTVNPLPGVSFGAIADVCIDVSSIALNTGSPAGGTYSGTGVVAGDFIPATAGVGTHILTYTFTDGNSCTDFATQTVSVNDLPTVTFGAFADICVNGGTLILSGGLPAGGTYSGTGVTAGVFDPAVSGVGMHTITYTYTDANNCVNSATSTINVNDEPLVVLSAFADICIDASVVTLSGGLPAGGTYSGTGVTAGVFDPAVAGAGTHTITYTYTDGNNCTSSATETITVHALPTVTLAQFTAVCEGTGIFQLSGGSPSGGTYSGTGVVGGFFDPAVAGVGIHSITYTYTDANGCTDFAIRNQRVNALPVVDAGLNQTIANGTSTTLTGTVSSGTPPFTYSWTPAADVVNPSQLSTATVNLSATTVFTLNVTSNNTGCSASDDITVNVTGGALAVSAYASPTTICLGGQTVLTALPSGGSGTYSYSWSPGSSLSDSTIANPTATPLATTTYTVTIDDGFNISTGTVTVTVNDLPAITFPAIADVCEDAANVALGATPVGGVYSGNGINGTNFVPSLAGVGTHTLTYTYTDGNGCVNSATQSVTVNALPTVTMGTQPPRCVDYPAFNLMGGQPTGGAYSGTGVSGGQFDPAVAGAGIHTITYTYSDANACVNTATTNITINALPSVTFSPIADVCIDNGIFALSGGLPTGGTYSGQYTAGGNFNPSAAGVGTHTVTYTYVNANNCVASDTQTVTVNALPTASFSGLSTAYCIDNGAVTLTGIPTGGTFTGAGISGNNFYPSVAGTGSWSITYTYTDGNGCVDTDVQSVTINALPTVNAGSDQSVCEGDTVNFLATGGVSYVWTGPNGFAQTIANPTLPNVLTSDAGAFTVTATDVNGCMNSDVMNLTVNPLPTPSIAGLNSSYCVSAGTVTLTGIPAGGTFMGTGVSGNIFNPSTAGVGTHNIMYTYTNANNCTNSTVVQVTVNALPTVGFSGFAATYCDNDAAVTLTGSPAGGSFSGAGVSGNMFYPSLTGAGTYSITYTYTDGNGCMNTDVQSATVYAAPTAAASASPQSVCLGASAMLTATGGTSYAWSNGGTTAQISVSPTSTTTYTVTVTNANGCTDATDVTVTVNPLPTAYNVIGGGDRCVGDGNTFSIGLDGSQSGVLYTLYKGGSATANVVGGTGSSITFGMFADSGMYTVMASNTVTTCDNMMNGSAQVVVNPLPIASAGNDVTACKNSSVNLIANGGLSYVWNTGATSQSINIAPVTDTTTYTVTVTDINGCSASDNVTINVTPLPTADAGMDQTVCQGDTVVITATGGVAYQWNTSSTDTTATITDVPMDTTVYSVIVFNEYGCSDNDTVVVNVNENPEVYLGPDVTICVNHSVTLDAGAGFDTYLWSNGATSQTVTVDTTGVGVGSIIYSVTVTLNNCDDDDQIQITFDPCQGIGEEEVAKVISVYPNPSKGLFSLTVTGYEKDLEMNIYNDLGELLVSEKLTNTSSEVYTRDMDLTSYPKGMYFIEFRDGTLVRTQKLIIH